MVVENGFDSDMMLMDMDEMVVLDNDVVQVATEQVEEYTFLKMKMRSSARYISPTRKIMMTTSRMEVKNQINN